MKIGYWLGETDLDSGGISTYAWRTLEVLLSKNESKNIEIIIFCTSKDKLECINLIQKYQTKAKIYLIYKKINWIGKFIDNLLDLFDEVFEKLNISRSLFKYLNPLFYIFFFLDLDVLHIPYQIAPLYRLPCLFLITMHDVQELHYPEFFSPKERAHRSNYFYKATEKASAIIVSFDHVKQDLIKYFNLSEDKIYVCPPPFQKSLLQKLDIAQISETYKKKYSKYDNFLLYPAQTWAHKNHLSLIKSIEYIKDYYGFHLDVICTGHKNIDFFPVLEKYLLNSKVLDQFNFVDVVPELELYWLYKNCSLVVIPTLYEAGSFPLFEAMFLDVPVICSSVTSLPETINDSRFIFDPLNIPQMSNLILEVLNNSEFRSENLVNGKKRANDLINLNNFEYFLKMYQKIIK